MKYLSITALVLIFVSLNSQAQNSKHSEKMLRLHPLVGHWEGSGWIQERNVLSEFRQTEDVSVKLDGTTLLIEGNAYANDSLVFQAMAIASYDQYKDQYRFNSFLADGKYTEAVGTFSEDGAFSWQFDVPNGGTVKYDIVFSESDWEEKGYYSPKDVEQWYPIMEMKLTKINNNDGK